MLTNLQLSQILFPYGQIIFFLRIPEFFSSTDYGTWKSTIIREVGKHRNEGKSHISYFSLEAGTRSTELHQPGHYFNTHRMNGVKIGLPWVAIYWVKAIKQDSSRRLTVWMPAWKCNSIKLRFSPAGTFMNYSLEGFNYSQLPQLFHLQFFQMRGTQWLNTWKQTRCQNLDDKSGCYCTAELMNGSCW